MKTVLLSLLVLFATTETRSECIHEAFLSHAEAINLAREGNQLFVENDGVFSALGQSWSGKRNVQWTPATDHDHLKNNRDYNDEYLTYYTPERMQQYLNDMKSVFESKGYTLKTVGKSIQGRPLYVLYPKAFRNNAKKVLMFGRHHGDEGTANWIIEGFLNRIFSPDNDWLEQFDLVLYPMVNPDGAHNRTRYNANGRDLNRVWGDNFNNSLDEVKTIHAHLDNLVPDTSSFIIALDMHGSFTEDFIYRVSENFRSASFYQTQQQFISTLAQYDPWQRGNAQTSNGHPKMARIRLVRDFGVNAMTHETIRNISRSSRRTLDDLKEQGEAIETTTSLLYRN